MSHGAVLVPTVCRHIGIMQIRGVSVLQAERRRVQAWLDSHLIADRIGDVPSAERVEASRRTWLSSLRITNEPLTGRRGRVRADPACPSTQGIPA